jgi:hypothetical protein
MPDIRLFLAPGSYSYIGSVSGSGTVPTLTAGTLNQSGTITVGTSITYTPSHALGSLSTIEWLRNGSTVVGTGASYTTVSGDVGGTIGVRETLGDKQTPVTTATVSVVSGGVFSDNFNRADGAMGSDWTVHQNIGGPANPGFQINTNEARFSVGTATGGVILRANTLISGGAFAEALFVNVLTTNTSVYGVALIDTALNRGYRFRQNRANGERLVQRGVSGSWTTIASASGANIPTGTVLRIERTIIDASTVRIRYLQGGSEVISFDDTNANRVTGDVYAGLYAEASTSTHGVRFDDFSQGAV